MTHSAKFMRLAKKLGVHHKNAKPGALLEAMHRKQGEPSFKKHKNPSNTEGLKSPYMKKHKSAESITKFEGEESYKKHKEPAFKHHKMACKHCKSMKHTTAGHNKVGHKKHKAVKEESEWSYKK